MATISDFISALVHKVFPDANERAAAIQRIEEKCSDSLPFTDEDFQLVDRIQAAVLKCSNGNLSELDEAIEEATDDWRDVLTSAGFAADPGSHKKWNP